MTDERLSIARWLASFGAGASASAVLRDLRGAAANGIRARTPELRLQPGIYALVSLRTGGGAAVPLRASLGPSRASDPSFRGACDTASLLARRALGCPRLPALRFEFEEWFEVWGASIGLPAALAFVAHYCPARAPAGAILATGELLTSGAVRSAGEMGSKLAAAAAENGVSLTLVPATRDVGAAATPVDTFETGLRLVFGGEQLVPEAQLLDLDVVLQRAREEPDRERGIAMLEALAPVVPLPADRARVWLELGTLLRHAGRSEDAAVLHQQAWAVLGEQRITIGAESAERYELECWSTRLDSFELEAAVAALTARLQMAMLSARNELRCRGMLAQALGMLGRPADAVMVRSLNLDLQTRSEALRRVLPGTYCSLAFDAARAGDADAFERFAELCCSHTGAGDTEQWRYNAATIVRGLVSLGRPEVALQWAADQTRIFSSRVPAPAALAGLTNDGGPVRTHPELSTLRALCRALRRTGRADLALALGDRVHRPPCHGTDLVAWIGRVTAMEVALARRDAGDQAGAAELLAEVRQDLSALHAAATRFHGGLLTCGWTELENEIDRVWY